MRSKNRSSRRVRSRGRVRSSRRVRSRGRTTRVKRRSNTRRARASRRMSPRRRKSNRRRKTSRRLRGGVYASKKQTFLQNQAVQIRGLEQELMLCKKSLANADSEAALATEETAPKRRRWWQRKQTATGVRVKQGS